MKEQWSQEYALLALRIDKVMRTVTDVPYVDGYYGPPEWKRLIDAEPPMDAAELAQQAQTLARVLPSQAFEPDRIIRLNKLVVAMETVCRKLNGEHFSLQEEFQGYFDFRPEWVPETFFEEALDTWDEILPGSDSLDQRWYDWHEQYRPTLKHAHLLKSIAERMLIEARNRTRKLVSLLDEEYVKIHAVSNQPFGAANFYQGNYQTLIEINTDLPFNVLELLDTLCHEGYPGHHTECVLKDRHLYQECAFVEQSIPIVLSPPCLISEGVAMLACEIIFPADELDTWLRENVYLETELAPAQIDVARLRTATDILLGARCNAAFMVREGRPEEEIREYLARYMQIPGSVENLMHPFVDTYLCTYYYGKQLVQATLQGPDRLENFRHLLTEPVFPSNLIKN